MRRHLAELGTGVRITLLMAVLCGLVYPLVIAGVSQIAFNNQANGSLVTSGGRVVGSTLIGQCFYQTRTLSDGQRVYLTLNDDRGNTIFAIDPRYFQSRPSFTVDGSGHPLPCNASASTGSNLGPSSSVLASRVRGYTDYLRSMGIARGTAMPVDLVTGDFTGFDPDISEAAALAQVGMVAAARHLPTGRVRALVEAHVAGRVLGVFGAPHVNVLQLNMALDAGAA